MCPQVCSSFFSAVVVSADLKQLGKGRAYSAYVSRPLPIPEGDQDRDSSSSRGRNHRGCCLLGCSFLLFNKLRMPVHGRTTQVGSSHINNWSKKYLFDKHAHMPIWWRQSFNWGFFFLDDLFVSSWQKLTRANYNYIIIFNVWNLKIVPSINLKIHLPHLSPARRNPPGSADFPGSKCEHSR